MRRRSALLGLALLGLSAGRAGATSGTAFGESPRAAALGNAVSARAGDAGTILLSPGGLADVSEPEVMLSGHAEHLSLWVQRPGEAREERTRFMGGFGFAAATPLPEPIERLRFGLALHLPAEHALRVHVDERSDVPTSPVYDGRPDRLSALCALGLELLPELKLGIGVAVTPSLSTPTDVSYDADRGDTVEKDVMVRLDRDLELDVAPFFGVRAQPLPTLGLAVVYRAAAASRAGGHQRTTAGGIVADDPIDYYQFWDPAELVVGAAVEPIDAISVSVDATYSRWSQLKSGFNRQVHPAFESTLSPRIGVQWDPEEWLALRAGYAFEPTPVPEQSGSSNYLGADTHVVGVGAGVDLRERLGFPAAVDAHVRTRLSATQTATKDPSRLPDADATLPGQQIDNLGYPGFSSSARFYQLGLSVTFFVGKEQRR